jgi:hypothetical protein
MSGTFGNFVPTYPNPLASGVLVDSTFVPFQPWAGEAQVVTQAMMANSSLAQFTVVALDSLNGDGVVAWNPNAGDGAPVASATGTYTFSAAPAANDTVTIAGNVITWAVAGTAPVAIPAAPESGEYPIETSGTVTIGSAVSAGQVIGDDIYPTAMTAAQASAYNLMLYVNAFSSTLGVNATVDVTGLIVTIEANSPGTAGNSITIAKSSSAIAVSGSTLAGGTVDSSRPLTTGNAIGFLMQPSTAGSLCPVCLAGAPNHEILIWPAGINTIAQRKAAFAGTPMFPSALV